MMTDLSHLIFGASTASRSGPAGGSVRPATDEVSPSGLYWNLFAYPVTIGSRHYALLTDTKAVLAIDQSTFGDLQRANGGPAPATLSDSEARHFLTLGLLCREPPSQQLARVFSRRKDMSPQNELLHVITSYTCNLTCSYCFMLADLDDHRARLLSFDDAKRGIDLYFSLPHKPDSVVHFYGGEPLLHPQLIDDCLQYIYRHYSTDIVSKIITNGTLAGPRVLKLLEECPFDLSVSMDGDRKAHDVFRIDHRGRSTFDQTIAGIARFQAIGYDPKILVTVGEHNIHRLPEIVSFVLDLRPRAIALNFPRELPRAQTGLDGCLTDTEFWVDQYERCLELCYNRHIPELYFADMLFSFLSGKPVLSPCAACGSQVSIGPGAKAGPCQAFVAAGMFSQDVDEFDPTSDAGPFGPWKKVSKVSSTKCSRCAIAAICGGDCSFDRYNRTGSLHEPLPLHCDLRLRMAQKLTTRLVKGQPIGFALHN